MRERTATVRINERGTVTIPKPIRDSLNIDPDDVIEVTVRVEEEDR